MKIFTIAIYLLCATSAVFGQTTEEKLVKLYSAEKLAELKGNNPGEYRLLVYALENGSYVTKAPDGKSEGYTSSINWANSGQPTFYDLANQFGIRLENFNQYIRMTGTDKMVVVKSRFVLENELSNKKN